MSFQSSHLDGHPDAVLVLLTARQLLRQTLVHLAERPLAEELGERDVLAAYARQADGVLAVGERRRVQRVVLPDEVGGDLAQLRQLQVVGQLIRRAGRLLVLRAVTETWRSG